MQCIFLKIARKIKDHCHLCFLEITIIFEVRQMVQIFGHGFVFKNWLALHRFSDSVKTINKYFQEKKTHESQWDEFITKKINDGLQKIAMHFFLSKQRLLPTYFFITGFANFKTEIFVIILHIFDEQWEKQVFFFLTSSFSWRTKLIIFWHTLCS